MSSPSPQNDALEGQLRLPVTEAARGLLGARLFSDIGGKHTGVMLTEVEAYAGAGDPASHAYRGRTARNSSMFDRAGIAYVYRSYGVHWCLNVVTGPVGDGAAVLLRAGEPIVGEAVMARRRGRSTHLTDGPGKLAQALGVTGDHEGLWLLGDGELQLTPGDMGSGVVLATPRVGISRAVDLPWRFVLARDVAV